MEFWDPAASVAIGVLLIFVAFWMARDARYMLVGARIDLADGLDAERVECVSDEIDARLREVVPDVTEVFVDATPPG